MSTPQIPTPRIPCSKQILGNPLVVQWLGLCASTATGAGSIPGGGTRIPQALRHGVAWAPVVTNGNMVPKSLLPSCSRATHTHTPGHENTVPPSPPTLERQASTSCPMGGSLGRVTCFGRVVSRHDEA